MNKSKLTKHLLGHGCLLKRQGGNHEVWRSVNGEYKTAVPRHREIDPMLVRSICRDLRIPPPSEK